MHVCVCVCMCVRAMRVRVDVHVCKDCVWHSIVSGCYTFKVRSDVG